MLVNLLSLHEVEKIIIYNCIVCCRKDHFVKSFFLRDLTLWVNLADFNAVFFFFIFVIFGLVRKQNTYKCKIIEINVS